MCRDFSATRPDEVWLSDFTYIRTREGWSYLAALDNAMAESIMSSPQCLSTSMHYGFLTSGALRSAIASSPFATCA